MKLINISTKPPYNLWMQWDDGIEWTVDLTPRHEQSVFHQLDDREFFNKAQINDHQNAVVRWDQLDIDADACYYNITGKNPFTS